MSESASLSAVASTILTAFAGAADADVDGAVTAATDAVAGAPTAAGASFVVLAFVVGGLHANTSAAARSRVSRPHEYVGTRAAVEVIGDVPVRPRTRGAGCLRRRAARSRAAFRGRVPSPPRSPRRGARAAPSRSA